ncbi:hypothetical protein CRUP_012669, partial [Coryphaenoides rupestris]
MATLARLAADNGKPPPTETLTAGPQLAANDRQKSRGHFGALELTTVGAAAAAGSFTLSHLSDDTLACGAWFRRLAPDTDTVTHPLPRLAGLFLTLLVVFPTEVRALGMGTCSTMAKLGALLTPFVSQDEGILRVGRCRTAGCWDSGLEYSPSNQSQDLRSSTSPSAPPPPPPGPPPPTRTSTTTTTTTSSSSTTSTTTSSMALVRLQRCPVSNAASPASISTSTPGERRRALIKFVVGHHHHHHQPPSSPHPSSSSSPTITTPPSSPPPSPPLITTTSPPYTHHHYHYHYHHHHHHHSSCSSFLGCLNRLQTSFVVVKEMALILQQEGCGKGPQSPTHHTCTGTSNTPHLYRYPNTPHLYRYPNTPHLYRYPNTPHLYRYPNTPHLYRYPNTPHLYRYPNTPHLYRVLLIVVVLPWLQAVRLDSPWTERVRYMVVVSTRGCQDAEENVLLGMDFLSETDSKSPCSVGMVLPLWSDTSIRLQGDGGFSVSAGGRSHLFTPVSVQAMWCVLRVLHKACEVSCRYDRYPGTGGVLAWTAFYESRMSSEQSSVNEWNAMPHVLGAEQRQRVERHDRPGVHTDGLARHVHGPTSGTVVDVRPADRESTECLIKAKLRSIMLDRDLESATSKEGSEWNAADLEELQDCGVGYVLNVTREVDNFFPETMEKSRSKCLVHCQMGVSRSVATVMAYAMRECGWGRDQAFNYVKQKRDAAQPNSAFLRQLAEYEGILDPGWVVVEVVEVEVVEVVVVEEDMVVEVEVVEVVVVGGVVEVDGGGGGGDASRSPPGRKHRHNKQWRSEAGDPETSDDGRASGLDTLEVSGEETPVLTSSSQEEEEAWGGGCSSGMSLEVEPLDPLNYNYYFRRLSDSALESGPSTPVRGPPLLGMERIFIEIEDVERDALLEDEGGGGGAFPGAHLAPGGAAAAAAQTCGRLDPMEDVRLRLEFSTLEEEDEEEAQKEEAEMEALARASRGPG